MNIYFSGAIRGGRDNQEIYFKIIGELKKYGTVLTEHVGNAALTTSGEAQTSSFLYKRDMQWIREADIAIAEVSTPSHGVGYEIGYAEALKKPVICLHRSVEERKLSAMIAGNPYVKVYEYQTFEELVPMLKEVFKK